MSLNDNKEEILDDQQQIPIAESVILENELFSNSNSSKSSISYHQPNKYPLVSWKTKFVVLMSMLIMPVGCHFMEATLATLKTTLKTEVNINNTQFSILMSSVTLISTILPFFAGVFSDDISSSIGTVRGTLAVNFIIFLGSLMVTFGANNSSFPIMLAGQLIYGIGDGVIVTFQEAVVSRWFRDTELAIVVGIMLSIARLTKFVAKLICYPIVDLPGATFCTPITVSMIICTVSFVFNLVYWLIMTRTGRASILGKELRDSDQINHKFNYTVLLYLPATFWMVPWMQISVSSVLSSFEDVATEYIQFSFGTSSVTAGIQSSLIQAVPILGAPLLGIYVHQYGNRLHLLLLSILTLIIALALLAYTSVTPYLGMVLVSLSLALGPVALLSAASLLLPAELAGIGVGLHKCSNNIGTTIIAVVVGYVQDLTFHDGDDADNEYDLVHAYDDVMILYLVVTVVSLLIAGVFWYMDKKRLKGWLQIGKKERRDRLAIVREQQEQKQVTLNEEEEHRQALSRIGSQLDSKKSFVCIGIYSFWLVVAWVVFFTFALMPVYESYSL